jgi:Tol biopolymer transport system component
LARIRIWTEVLLVAILAGLFAGRTLWPAWRSLNTDFPNYYVAARLYTQGASLARVYDWVWYQRQKDHLGLEKRIVSFVPFTLYSAMPLVPFASMAPLTAKHYWLVICLVLLGFSVFLLCRMTRLGVLRTAMLVLLAIEPLHTQFLYGQLHILMLLLILAAFWFYSKDWPVVSGGMLAIAAAFKIYPILFVFYFLRKKQWRAVAGLVGVFVLLAALSVVLFGMEVNREYVQEVLPRIARGEGLDPYNLGWNSITGVLHRLFLSEPQLNAHPIVDSPAAYVLLQPLASAFLFIPLLWLLTPYRASTDREALDYGAYIVGLLLLSTHPASYHYVVLIAAAVLVTNTLLHAGRKSHALLFVVLYALACLPTHRSGPRAGALAVLTSSSRLIFTLGIFALLLAILTSLSAKTWRERLRSPGALAFVPLFLAMISAGWLDNYTRFHQKDAGERIAMGSDSLLKSMPSMSDGRIAYTELHSADYAVGTVDENQLSIFEAKADLFQPAVIPNSSQALVELAETTSKIVKLDLSAGAVSGQSLPIVVNDGESPVISADGRWLLFIREAAGKGGLWLKSLDPAQPAESKTGELKLADAEYDVLEASVDPDGSEIIFAAQPHGEPELFTMERTSSRISQTTFGPAARYPAVSPDGGWLAYARLNHGSWQIFVKARHDESSGERQLTHGECNSTYPAWTSDSKELVYATDCSRGLGLTALTRIRAVP